MKHADVGDLRRRAWWPAAGPGPGPGRPEDRGGRRRCRPRRCWTPNFDGRVSALAYASVRMLTALGVWEHLAPTPSRSTRSWSPTARPGQPASPFSLHFDAGEIGRGRAGPYRREPAYPRRALCRRGAHAQSDADRARCASNRWRSKPARATRHPGAMANRSGARWWSPPTGAIRGLRDADGHRRDRLVLSANRHRRDGGA